MKAVICNSAILYLYTYIFCFYLINKVYRFVLFVRLFVLRISLFFFDSYFYIFHK